MQKPTTPKTILIVDDARINRALLKKIFGGAYHILEAEDGVEALEIMRSTPDIDLVLLDIFMPRKNGFAVLETMAQEKALKGIPAVVVTSAGDAETQIRALDSGAADVIAKPYQPQIILHRVSNILNRLESERIAERSRMVEQQLRMMETDPKTGLYNKMAFCRHVSDILKDNPDTSYVILRWDVDHFRAFNEIYGMVQGDAILAGVGHYYLKNAIPADGVIIAGHWHADCFVTLREKGHFDPERIMETIERYAQKSYPDFEFLTRIGMYEITDRSLDVAMMCDRAMLALRSIKNNFKTRYAWYDESMRRSILEEQEISSEARTALAEGQFVVYFQPQYDYANQALSGAEALVRWIHPQKGVISPGRFVPLFEENGFICKLDQYVWERACCCLRKWLDEGLKPVPVSVNVSRQDIYNINLSTVFQNLLEKYSLAPEMLHLEITESAYMENPDQLVRVVRQLQGCGFHMEMDDFGSGYSSLNTLKDVPVDTLKLDMKFLSEDEDNTRGGSILSSVVHMAHGIGLPVIAEGVETRQQAEYLKSVGCQYMQGYLFAQPMPLEQYEALLRKSHIAAPDQRFSAEIGGAADFLSAATQSTLLFNSFVGGAAILEYENGKTDLLRVNNKFLEILGMSYEAYVHSSQQFLDCIAPEHRKTFLRMLDDAIREGNEAECELHTLPQQPAEKSVWLHVRARFLTQKANSRLLYIAIDDINMRMNLLRHNTELSQRFSAIVRNLPGAVYNYEITAQGVRLAYFNDRAAEMFGFTREEYACRFMEKPLDMVHPEDRAALEETAQRVFLGQSEDFMLRFRHICRDGSWRWGQIHGSVSHRTAQTAFASAILLDIEKEVESERLSTTQARELEHQRAFLQELYSTIPCGIMRFTVKDGKLYLGSLNDAAWKIFGFAGKIQYLESVQGKRFFKDTHPDDRKLLEENIQMVLRDGSHRDFNHRILREDGSVRWVHTLLQKVQPQDANDVLQFVFTDSTDQFRKDLDRYSAALLGMYDETYELDMELSLCTLRAGRKADAAEQGKVYEFHHALDKACESFVLPEDRAALRAFLDFSKEDAAASCPRTLEIRFVGLNGQKRWSSITVLHAGGSQYLLCSRDITAEKSAAALERENSMLQAAASERKAEEKRNRIFMDAMGVLVFDYDPATDVMKFSSRTDGENAAGVTEHYLRDLLSNEKIAAADRLELKNRIQKALRAPSRQTLEYTSNRFGGFGRSRTDFVSVGDAQGKIYRVVGVISPMQDKAQQRQIAEELMQLTGTKYEGQQYQAQIAEQMLQIFNEAQDINAAVQTVLGVIGRKMETSRVYVTEEQGDGIHCTNTFEWCNTGIRPQIDRLQNFVYPAALRPYANRFNADGILSCPDVSKAEPALRAVLEPQGVHSTVHCAILVDGVFRGYVGFDDCVRPHEWTETQIHTLILLTRVLTAYVYGGAAGAMRDFKAQQKAMEESRAYIFILDPDSMEVLYTNRAARAEYGVALLHETCYSAFSGQAHPCEACPMQAAKNGLSVPVQIERRGKRYILQAAHCRWNGRAAMILTGTDAASFAQQPELTRKTRYRYERQQIVHSLYHIYDEILELDYLKNTFSVLNTKENCGANGRPLVLDKTVVSWADTYVRAEDRAAFCNFMQLKNMRANCAGNSAPMLEYHVTPRGKKERWCRATILQIDANRYLCCNLDITEQKQAQALHAQNETLQAKLDEAKRYQIIISHADCAVVDWNFEKGTFYASEALQKYTLSLAPQEELLHNCGPVEAVYPEDRAALNAFYLEMKSGAQHAECELRLKMRAGGYHWTQMKADFVRDENGGLLRAVGSFTDIHSKVLAEQKHKGIDARTKELMRRIPAGIVVYGEPSACPLYLNDRACKMFGFTHMEYERCMANGANACPIPDVRALAPEEEHAFAPGEHGIQRLHLQKKDGTWFWLSALCYNVAQPGGGCLGYTVLMDVTQRAQNDHARMDRQQEMAAMIRSIPGGIFKYSADGDRQFSFVSDNMLEMLGYTREEFLQKFHNRFSDMIYSGDRARVLQEIDEQIKTGDFDTCEYRIETHSGALTWVYDAGHLIVDEDGNRWYVVVIVDIEKRKQLEQALEKEKQRANALIANAPGGVIEYDVTSGSPVVTYLSNDIARMLGYEPEELLHLRRKDVYNIVHPEDVEIVQAAASAALTQHKEFNCEYRIRSKNGRYRWVSLTANPAVQADGRCVYYGTYSDITQLRRMEDLLREYAMTPQSAQAQSMLDILPCGVTILDAKGRMCYTNRAGRAMRVSNLQAGAEEFRLSPWETEKLEAARRAAIKSGKPQPYEYALSMEEGEAVWISGVMYRTVSAQGKESLLAVYNDVSRLKTERRQMEELIENLPGGVLLYRIENGRPVHTLSSTGTARLLGYCSDQEMNRDFQNTLAKHFYEQDRLLFFRRFFEAIAAERPFQGEFRVLLHGGEIRWISFNASPMRQQDETLYFCGICADVTEKKAAEEKEAQRRSMELMRFCEDIQYLESAQSENLLGKIRFNHTRDKVEGCTVHGKDAMGLSSDEAREMVILPGNSKKDQKALNLLLSRKRLLADFAEGKSEASLEYQGRDGGGHVVWVRVTIKTFRDPQSGDIKSFVYSNDIDEARTSQAVIDRVAEMEFELLGVLRLENGLLHCYRHSMLEEDMHCGAEMLYHPAMTAFIQRYLPAESRAEARSAFAVDNLCNRLKTDKCCEFTYSIEYGGKAFRKHWAFMYLDETKTSIIYARTDITGIFAQQDAQQKRLRQALSQAQLAIQAKTEFLARMSHEMRTPMNAIIGLAELTADSAEEPAYVRNTMAQIVDSGQLLLRQINDVLEVSHLQSAEIQLKKAPYRLEELCDRLDMLLRPMCEKKKIRFEILPMEKPGGSVQVYAGGVRFQQIFFNLLSNAVKFTPEGGAVAFGIEKLAQTARMLHIRATVTDTGVGISENFQKHIFEPFVRGESLQAGEAGGAGLGLTVAKRLVELMHGTIQVRSVVNEGSCFTVELPLKLYLPEYNTPRPAEIVVSALRGRHVLLVEDNHLNTVIAKALLEKQGAIVDCAENGAAALARFQASALGYYDAVLMDIRMPVMDGLAATRALRALPRKEVATLPIVSVSANTYPEDVRDALAAGVDAHLPKPIDPAQLYETLSGLILKNHPHQQ